MAVCPAATFVDYPLRPASSYSDVAGPFLDKVWFKGTPNGCDGGSGSLCTPTNDPESCSILPAAGNCDYWKLHTGQDLNFVLTCPPNDPGGDGCDCDDAVYAIGSGTVVQRQAEDLGGFGKWVLIEHRRVSGPNFYSFYGHLSSVDVEVGDCVTSTSMIGVVGESGFAVGCHLHFEIRVAPLPSEPGRGYAHHYCGDLLSRYADPATFIARYASPVLPTAGSHPEPEDGDILPQLDQCVDDHGTKDTADDVTGECLQWRKAADAEYYDVYLDGTNHLGRSWVGCQFLNQSLAPGTHEWEARAKSWAGTNEDVPTWSFEIAPICPAQPAGESSSLLSNGACAGTPPAVTTLPATNVTGTSASLNMSVNPGGLATTIYFDYDTDTNFCCVTSPPRAVGAATSTVTTSVTLSGLNCGSTYFVRARGNNAAGAATPGSIFSFPTPACGGGGPQTLQLVVDPSFEAGPNGWWVASPAFYIDGLPAFPNAHTGSNYAFLSTPQGVAGNGLNGGVISPAMRIPANATDADIRFYYSITSSETTTSTEFDYVDLYLVPAGTTSGTWQTRVSNLNETSGTTYGSRSVDLSSSWYGDNVQIYFKGHTDDSLPTLFRIDDVTLEVDVPSGDEPEVTTRPADQVTATSARLNMLVNPNGGDTEIWFDLDANDSTPSPDTEHVAIGGGVTSIPASVTVYDLECDTLYYFEAHAQNQYGSDVDLPAESFRTAACAGGRPNADTDPATNVTATSATLTSEVNPNGLPTVAWFAWGESENELNLETPRTPVGSGTTDVDFTYTLTGLLCEHDYYFENHALNSVAEDDGVTLSFRTASCGGSQLPIVTVSVIDAEALEADLSSGVVRIERTGSTAESLSLAVGISGTATNASDYQDISGFIDIPAGSSYRDIVVRPLQDQIVESDETVTVTIFETAIYDLGSPSSGTVTIVSDDDVECEVTAVRIGDEGVPWIKGTQRVIEWDATSGCATFRVVLFRNGLGDMQVSGPGVTGRQYVWNPPAWVVPGSGMQIEIVGFSDTAIVTADSAVFSLVNPPVLPQVLFSDSVETTAEYLNYWTPNFWQIADGEPVSHSPTHSHTDSVGNYPSNQNSALLTPFIDLSGRSSLIVRFWHRYEFANNGDHANIWMRASTSAPWQFRYRFSGTLSAWTPAMVDLWPYVSGPMVQIAFQLFSDGGLEADGWYIDDVWIGDNRIFADGFESGDAGHWGLGDSGPQGLTGTWSGSIANHPNSWIEIRDEPPQAHAWIVVAGELPPEEMTNVIVFSSAFQANRPRDNNAEVSLILNPTTNCLNGSYIELGTSRPVSICRVQ